MFQAVSRVIRHLDSRPPAKFAKRFRSSVLCAVAAVMGLSSSIDETRDNVGVLDKLSSAFGRAANPLFLFDLRRRSLSVSAVEVGNPRHHD